MPWFIALLGSIFVMAFTIYKNYNIGLTMLMGSLALGLLSGISAGGILAIFIEGLWNSITIMLVLSILLLGVLGHILKTTGALNEIIVSLQGLISDIRIISASIPALIGMLTVPGGAILSAPLCAEAGSRLELPPERQAVINVWFRHVSYFMLPLFPSLILAAQLAEIPIRTLVIHNTPLTIIGAVFGFYFLFRGSKTNFKSKPVSGSSLLLLIKSILPLLAVMILVVFTNLYFPLALLAGIVIAILNYLPHTNRVSVLAHRVRTMLLPGIKIPVAMVIAGIMIYKEMLTSSGVIADLTGMILSTGLPLLILIAVIPFFLGVLTGDNSASIAVVYPMFMPLLPLSAPAYGAYLAFLYASSTAGHIISPAHPCFSLTKEYYTTDFKKIILPTLPLLGMVMAAGLLITSLFGVY